MKNIKKISEEILPANDKGSLADQIKANYATEEEAAKALNVAIRTLRNWSVHRRGPKGRMLVGRKVYYKKTDLLAWLEKLASAKN